MALPTPTLQIHSIVLLGDFAPQNYPPAWFAAKGLIKGEEATAAKVNVIHPGLCDIELDWVKMQILPEKFIASTKDQVESLRDLVLGTIQIMSGTSIKMMGLNWEYNYPIETVSEWNKAGDRLAPKADWEGLLKEPGLLSMQMQGHRTDSFKGAVNVKVGPSPRIPRGIFFELNDHYDFTQPKEGVFDASRAIEVLSKHWLQSTGMAKNIIEKLLEKLLS